MRRPDITLSDERQQAEITYHIPTGLRLRGPLDRSGSRKVPDRASLPDTLGPVFSLPPPTRILRGHVLTETFYGRKSTSDLTETVSVQGVGYLVPVDAASSPK